MAVMVELPPSLARLTGGTVVEVPLSSGTVGEVLGQLVRRYPALQVELFEPGGSLDWAFAIFLNGVALKPENCLQAKVQDGDRLRLEGLIMFGGGH